MTDEEKVLAWLNCNCIGNDNPSCESCPFTHCDEGEVEETIRNLIEDKTTTLVDKGEGFPPQKEGDVVQTEDGYVMKSIPVQIPAPSEVATETTWGCTGRTARKVVKAHE